MPFTEAMEAFRMMELPSLRWGRDFWDCKQCAFHIGFKCRVILLFSDTSKRCKRATASIGKEHVQRFPITRDLLIDPIDVFHLGYVGLDAHATLPAPIGCGIQFSFLPPCNLDKSAF